MAITDVERARVAAAATESNRLTRLLVATDGLANGDSAVAYAVALGRRHRSELLLCYAVDHARAVAECSASNGGGELLMPLVADLDAAAESILAEAAKLVTAAGLEAKTTVLDGPPAEAIAARAAERMADAIVMGTQGVGGFERLLLGSTVDGVLRRAAVPVFVVPHVPHGPARFERILVGVDESDPSDAAIEFAITLAAMFEAQLVFCAVTQVRDVLEGATAYTYDPAPMVRELREMSTALLVAPSARARKSGLVCETLVAEGDPADQLLANAELKRADLIVVGTHGRRGLRRLFVGSVAEGVVRRSRLPVAVVRASPMRHT